MGIILIFIGAVRRKSRKSADRRYTKDVRAGRKNAEVRNRRNARARNRRNAAGRARWGIQVRSSRNVRVGKVKNVIGGRPVFMKAGSSRCWTGC